MIKSEVDIIKMAVDDVKCGRTWSRDEVAARLKSSVGRVMAAAPLLMSDQYKFNGEEINGPRK